MADYFILYPGNSYLWKVFDNQPDYCFDEKRLLIDKIEIWTKGKSEEIKWEVWNIEAKYAEK